MKSVPSNFRDLSVKAFEKGFEYGMYRPASQTEGAEVEESVIYKE